MDLGDRAEDSTIDFTFSARNVSAAPANLTSGTVSVYKANGATQSTAGITLTAPFDSITGLQHVRIDTSADAFYATGNDYSVVLTVGTVNSVSVVGTTIATFSIENRRSGSGVADWTTAERNEIRGRLGITGTTAAGGNTPTLSLEATLTARTILSAAYFDPSADTVTVGTNNDKTGYSLTQAFPTNFAALGIEADGDITKVNLVAVTTLNTDMRGTNGVDTATMRGTDGANTVVPDAAGVAPTAVENRQEMDSNSVDLNTLISGQTTAQNDLDIITGTDGTTLATSQPNQDYGTLTKNAAFPNFEFLMVLTSDGRTPGTGLTVSGQRSIDGGAFASVAGGIAEVSNGIYQFDALAADTNGDVITWRFSAATADDTFVTLTTTDG